MDTVDNLNLQNFRSSSFTIRYRCAAYSEDEVSDIQSKHAQLQHHEWVADALRHFEEKSDNITATIYVHHSVKDDHIKAKFLVVGDFVIQEHLGTYFKELKSPFDGIEGVPVYDNGFYEYQENELGAPYGSPTFHVQGGEYFYRYDKNWYQVGPLRVNALHKDVVSELISEIEKIDFG